MSELVELDFYRLIVDDQGQSCSIVLKEMEGEKFLPIYIGANEAKSIQTIANDETPIRPMTHDLAVNMLESVNIEILSVVITKIIDSNFYADINLRHFDSEEVISVDSRPSDALSLAIRCDCPIYCSQVVMNEAHITC